MTNKNHNKNCISSNFVSQTFCQGDKLINVLNDINYKFYSDETYAITGASGAGKSTLLHIISGLLRPSFGSVYLNEHDIYSFTSKERAAFLRSKIGLIFQLPYLLSDLTVLENIMIKGLINNGSYKDCEKKAFELLERIGLSDKAGANPKDLSGGEAQRVAIARAIYSKPLFLFADEPTAHLDESSKKIILDLLLECHQNWHMGLIVATHDAHVVGILQNKFELVRQFE